MKQGHPGLPERRRPRVAVVIGSGGLKCAAALGVLKVLQREGIGIDMAIGCSGGSFFATAIALGADDMDEVAGRFARGWSGTFGRIGYRTMLSALFPRLFGFGHRFALLDDRKVNAAIEAFTRQLTFADTRIPLHLAATDYASGEKVVLSHGKLADAIRASIAIPLVLPPWPVEGRLLFDGGASNPVPVDVATREGCDIVIAMGFEEPVDGQVQSAMQLARRAISITVNHFIRSQYALYSLTHHAEVIPILPVFERRIGLRDLSELPYIMALGERAAEAEIPYLRRLLAAGMTAMDREPGRAP
ncbi:patatin-like phospholipase family protein [Variovorax saccharolyticus]|uniref:patatin-like phospholipase family protein n=1 Tax=Variovorax saccharolyticus TaxID=3053516 RepID=UPI002575C39D|nr:patatin-like phospholipase family protein [Variovorax sp. J31P216]MDM0027486.1 patatin-like phospholipase family protein [Variovorax sp. J31P216]